ncbi:hypothetical protein [Bacillus sp. FJAT-50079]|uniref:MotE family protein n=1 Tax=Bacillus sp. FJAT-50079 TaxID=2833577 RepID=UPI002015FEB5|nr:hypothetical protein [Bacillus sp. FJAT-50079]
MKKQKEVKEASLLQRFIFWGIIPLLFALFIGLLITSLMGINVFEKAKEISGKLTAISNMKVENENIVQLEEKIIHLDAEIQDKDAEISQLKSQIESKEAEQDRLLLEQQRLEETIAELRQIQDENKRAFKEMIMTFEAMTAKKSAPIIMEMKEEEALKILANLSTESLAKVMENMPAKDAAAYSEKLSAITN